MRHPGRRFQLIPAVAALALGAVLGSAVTLGATARVLAPLAVDGPRADAVVVLAGSPRDRLARGLELMNQGAAPTLVLSAGVDQPRGWAPIDEVCGGRHAFEVICLVPESDSTRGEAVTISRLAHERGWSSLALVTSSYHLDRATRYFDACFDGDVHPVAATPSRITWPLVRHELLGAVHARTVGLLCPGTAAHTEQPIGDLANP